MLSPTIDERLRMRNEPKQPHVMYQRWRSLLFLHFPCPRDEIQRLLPPGLEVDLHPDSSGELKAWVGLVPFRMAGVRPRFMPSVPGVSNFPEFNLRTYVHRAGAEPGVWFFTLEAANAVACRVARRFFGLPYREARMSVEEQDGRREYRSQRLDGGARVEVRAEFDSRLPDAEPGTLEFFLVERYLLYSYRGGSLYKGRVHHVPYPLRSADAPWVDEGLTSASGIVPRPYIHRLASDGVDVKIYPLTLAA